MSIRPGQLVNQLHHYDAAVMVQRVAEQPLTTIGEDVAVRYVLAGRFDRTVPRM
ncbi:hypothetical protein ABZY09_14070 [Streptomyces sp. NPDC002928]|uniref:hypothetical protein n=1 Tax=Streptomyces sp. NPDC002928 TaxID=3154440 RepID=UPI0033A2F070